MVNMEVNFYRSEGTTSGKFRLEFLKMEIDENNLEKVAKKDLPREKDAKRRPRAAVRTTQTRKTSARLDLRGHRYEQAMSERK